MQTQLLEPEQPLPEGLQAKLRHRRVHAKVTAHQTVRIDHPLGSGELALQEPGSLSGLFAGLSVYVWWSSKGPVCAPVAELDRTAARDTDPETQVRRAREALALARRVRQQLASERRSLALSQALDVELG